MNVDASDRFRGAFGEQDGELDDLVGGPNPDATPELVGATNTLLLKNLSLVPYLPAVLKLQGRTGTCVPHGIANAVETRMAARGLPVPPSSRRQIFTLSNMLIRRHKTDRPTAEGTYARAAMAVCRAWGIAEEADWPFVDDDGLQLDVTEEVPPHVLARASSWKLDEQSTVYALGDARVRAVRAAVDLLEPLPVVTRVDAPFDDYAGGEAPIPAPGISPDLHMVCVVGYRTVNGRLQFLIVNSWAAWGLEIGGHLGLGWVSEEWIKALREVYRVATTRGRRIVT